MGTGGRRPSRQFGGSRATGQGVTNKNIETMTKFDMFYVEGNIYVFHG